MGYAVWKKGNGSDNTLYYVYTDDSRASAITMAHKLFEVYEAVVVRDVESNKPVLIMQRRLEKPIVWKDEIPLLIASTIDSPFSSRKKEVKSGLNKGSNAMNVVDEINKFSLDSDKPVLLWLFDRYHMQSQWSFVARCNHSRYGVLSYQVNRVWYPTEEGKIIYNHYKENQP